MLHLQVLWEFLVSKIFKAFIENEISIKRIFNKYFKRSEDIEDLTHETFLKCFAAELKIEIKEPRAFLFRVAKNLALSEVKKKSHRKTKFIEDFSGSDVLLDRQQASAEAQIDGQRKLVAFTKAIANLPEPYQRAFLMRKVEKLKFKQIATRLDVSVSTVEKRVAAAFVMCNGYLRDQGYDMSEFGASPNIKRTPTVLKIKYGESSVENESNKRKRDD